MRKGKLVKIKKAKVALFNGVVSQTMPNILVDTDHSNTEKRRNYYLLALASASIKLHRGSFCEGHRTGAVKRPQLNREFVRLKIRERDMSF